MSWLARFLPREWSLEMDLLMDPVELGLIVGRSTEDGHRIERFAQTCTQNPSSF